MVEVTQYILAVPTYPFTIILLNPQNMAAIFGALGSILSPHVFAFFYCSPGIQAFAMYTRVVNIIQSV